MRFIEPYRSQIEEACRKHQVKTMYVFGSASTETMNENSDVDLLVKFKSFDLSKYFENYMSLKETLKKLLNREVDLLEERTLKNSFLIRSIERSKELVYGWPD
ncbi:MAG: nucleotidyltransferase domain-containing protein [Flavobacteriales bacterium]|nr:nucleotidyltransferase domain-containing protein [Flavobacteriales bacterium]